MTPVDKSLVSTRNLQDSGVGPLRKFYGDFEDYITEDARGYEGSRVLLRFASVEVIQATEPYAYPVAEINIGLSNKKKSKWGYLSESLVKFLKPEEDIKDCLKRRMGLVYTDGLDGRPPAKMLWNRKEAKDELSPGWEVFDVLGARGSTTSSDALEHLKGLLDGKSLSEFNKIAFGDPVVKSSPDIQTALTNRTFINSLVQLGEFSKDTNDIYHRTKK